MMDLGTISIHAEWLQHCFILILACSCRLELAYFSWKISKNRLVCKKCRCIVLLWELETPSNGLLSFAIQLIALDDKTRNILATKTG